MRKIDRPSRRTKAAPNKIKQEGKEIGDGIGDRNVE
jgi:hypothetical protein